MLSINKKRASLLLFVVVLGLGIGLAYARLNAKDYGIPSTAMEGPTPRTMEELASGADLIIVGRVGQVVNQGTFYGYDTGAKKRAMLDKSSPTSLGIPITDYEIDIERVLLDDGTVSSGKPVILRILENFQASSPSIPKTGARRLFFLTHNPDHATYGISSLLNQIDIERPAAVYYNGKTDVLPFGEELRPEEFIQQVEKTLERSQRTPYQD
jgi:hypothetical protein